MSVAHRLERAWYAKAPWLWLLRPLEFLFRAITYLRRSLYRRGWLSSYRASVPVVIVGNITVGGTGKTPIVIALLEALQAAGLRPGVVSRGYGAKVGKTPHVLSQSSTAEQAGDEPLLIYKRTGAPCVVAPNRAAAVAELERRFSPDIIISDDGLQHYALQRDFEIAVLDNERRVGNAMCLPAGPLRESAQRLSTVDVVLYRGSSSADNGVQYMPGALVNLADQRSLAFSQQSIASKVYAVAGIGQPEQFFSSLRSAGFELIERRFPDHHLYQAAELEALQDHPIIMTEKDAVKCQHLAQELIAQAWFLRIDARLPESLCQAVRGLLPEQKG
ncbi:tetraacyldisaccharide 4'-kinase [Parahaliea sp. F7430]|uniref:Tetraacyldisaccharide 4'-kinase n=1 Tax=Sediminihaliea albiluteola TaxID=2758564 RepID=A0A7W2YJB7_9GAMM|nr:tetraacyldisaccharide 4'-kinase [Sediminihaliea albiluteola]MBA6412128.1 tetraacyldisaccharide 4'-kinase [Sediminihaliea albiluteola]